jgi:hypothetical protein
MNSDLMSKASSRLTANQHKLLESALASGAGSGAVTRSQRQKIREICDAAGDRARRPEQMLVAFKVSLTEVVNDAKIPLGDERSALIDRFVSVFIEELYRSEAPTRMTADGDSRGQEASPTTLPKTPDLSDARL